MILSTDNWGESLSEVIIETGQYAEEVVTAIDDTCLTMLLLEPLH